MALFGSDFSDDGGQSTNLQTYAQGVSEGTAPEVSQEVDPGSVPAPAPAPVSVSTPEPIRQQQPQDESAPALDPKLWKIVKAMRDGLGTGLEGSPESLNSLAMGIGTPIYNELQDLRAEMAKAQDESYFNTVEGRKVSEVMKLSKHMTKDVAKDLVRNYDRERSIVEQGAGGSRGPKGYQLSDHDKMVAKTLGITQADYIKEFEAIARGENYAPQFNELVIEVM